MSCSLSARRDARRSTAGRSGTATDVLEFSYAVQSGDFDADGVALCASGPGCGSIQLDGGTIRAASDEADALLRHPALAAQRGAQGGCGGAAARGVADRADGRARTRSHGAVRLGAASLRAMASGGKFRLLFKSPRTGATLPVDEHRPLQQLRAGPDGERGMHGDPELRQAGFQACWGAQSAVNRRAGQHLLAVERRPMSAVYWLNGIKVADNYGDMYDGNWDDADADRLEKTGTVQHRCHVGRVLDRQRTTNGTTGTDLSNYLRAVFPTNGAGFGGPPTARPLGSLNESGSVLRRIFT